MQQALQELSKRLSSANEVKVGFLEGATYPDGTSVPMVAAIQNFGAPEKNIPPRPFFSDMVKAKSPTWGKKVARVLRASDFDADKALALTGEAISGELQKSILDLQSPELADSTVAAKGFSKPLIDTAHMMNSVQYQVDSQSPVSAPQVSGGRVKSAKAKAERS